MIFKIVGFSSQAKTKKSSYYDKLFNGKSIKRSKQSSVSSTKNEYHQNKSRSKEKSFIPSRATIDLMESISKGSLVI